MKLWQMKLKVYIYLPIANEYNVGEISNYAKKMFKLQRYDEVEAEYCALKKRKD